jgi:hypothetical protein
MHSSLSFKQFKKLSYFMAALFLAVHIVMLCIFRQSGVMPMCAVNLCSIAFYCAMLFLIHRDCLRGFVVASFLEICLHMGLAEYYTGWNSDFQITLIGICVLLFYAEYIGKSMYVACTPAVFLAPAAVLAYLVPLVIDHIRPRRISFPPTLNSSSEFPGRPSCLDRGSDPAVFCSYCHARPGGIDQ